MPTVDQSEGVLPRANLGKPGVLRAVLPAGAQVIWGKGDRCRLARIVALIPGGKPPTELAPEIRGLNRWRVNFRDPSLARVRDHYLVSRIEFRPRLGHIVVYYLPDAHQVKPVRSGS